MERGGRAAPPFMFTEPTGRDREEESCLRRALRLSIGDAGEVLKTIAIACGSAVLLFLYRMAKLGGFRAAWEALVNDWKQAIGPAVFGIGGLLFWYLVNIYRALKGQRDEMRSALRDQRLLRLRDMKKERVSAAATLKSMRRETANIRHAAYDAARVLRSNVIIENILDPSSEITLLDVFRRAFVDSIMPPPWTAHMVSVVAFSGANEFQEQNARKLVAALVALDLAIRHEADSGKIVWEDSYWLKPDGHMLARLLRKPRQSK